MTLLYGWGANSHGQLGLGFVSEQVLEPIIIDDLLDTISESTIKHVCGGGGHTVLLTDEGKLFGAGLNTGGQVGNGTQERSVTTFQQIRGLEDQNIVDVACGWSHSVALNSQGQVWVWGTNTHCQLGLPNEEVPFCCLPIVLDITDVVSIAAGLRHTAVATKDGHVYTWGHGHRGQLGYIDDKGEIVKRQTNPRKVEMIGSKVVQVACGQNTTYALTCEGHVLAWGDNKWGQLAHSPRNLAFFSCPLAIPVNYFGGKRTSWLKVGWTHCAAGMASGEVYMWGRSDYGQLGPTTDETDSVVEPPSKSVILENLLPTRCCFIPACVEFGKSIKKFACGSEHNVTLVEDTDQRQCVMTWGWNEHGNCGNGATENLYSPHKISFRETVLVIGSGAGHSFALVKAV